MKLRHNRPLRRIAFTGLLLAALPAAAAGEGGAGPVPLRILAPLHSLSYQLTPQSAELLAPGRSALRLELSESNVLQFPHDAREPYLVHLDFETTRLQLGYRRGLAGGWEVGFEVPLLYYHSGFLDHTVLEVEEAFGKVKPRRSREVHGSYAYEVSRGGETLFAGPENEIGLGDAALTFGRFLGRGGGWRPALAFRGAVALPTGDRDRAFGNGIPELALGLAADWRRGRWWLTSGGAVTLPLDQVERTPGLTSVPVLYGYAEVAYRRPRLGLHLQWAVQTGPYRLHGELEPGPELPITDHVFTHQVFQLTPALSWRLSEHRTLHLGLVQDINHSEDSAADGTGFAVLTVGF